MSQAMKAVGFEFTGGGALRRVADFSGGWTLFGLCQPV